MGYVKNMLTENFFKNLNQAMEQSGVKKTDLAKAIGASQPTVSNWFSRGKIPDAEWIEKIAKHLNVENYYFFLPPGSQATLKPSERHDDFKTLLDDLAEKCLSPIELETYKKEGPSEYVRVLRTNYESSHLLPVGWCLKLNTELAKYASVNLEEKLKTILAGQGAKKGQVS